MGIADKNIRKISFIAIVHTEGIVEISELLRGCILRIQLDPVLIQKKSACSIFGTSFSSNTTIISTKMPYCKNESKKEAFLIARRKKPLAFRFSLENQGTFAVLVRID